MNKPSEIDKGNRLFYADLLRAIATCLVIILHSSAIYCHQYNKIGLLNWSIANIVDSFTRFSVPIFIMLSGMLLLANDKVFNMKRRILHVAIPLVSFSLVYIMWLKLNNKEYNVMRSIVSVLAGPVCYHLWFCYTVIGLYLFVPVLRHLTRERRLVEYLLILWFIFIVVVPFFSKMTGILWGIDINVFFGYMGLFVLGYYLHAMEIKMKGVWYLFIFIFSWIGTAVGTYILTKQNSGILNEYFYVYLTPNVVAMSICFFMLCKKIEDYGNRLSLKLRGFIALFSSLSYGIFLMHVLVLSIVMSALSTLSITKGISSPLIEMALVQMLTISVSFLASYLLSMNRYTKFLFLGN